MTNNNFTIEQKLGQMFIFGFRGAEITSDDPVFQLIQNGLIGGVILFDRDIETNSTRNIQSPEQLSILVSNLQALSPIPLFVAIDQEGGQVARLRSENGFPDFPSHSELGKENNLERTRFCSKGIAEVLSEFKINVNFAPVADLALNENNAVVVKKQRCFGSHWELVSRNCSIFIREHIVRNILPVVKHFPGHGSSSEDSHFGFVDITREWKEDEIKPYGYLAKEGNLPAVMVGHLYHKNFDPNFPASLSHIWIDEILRKEIGFDGLVFTDDLGMKAITEDYELKEVLKLAINAGNNVLVFANQQNYRNDLPILVLKTAIELFDEGKISIEKIDFSFKKIIETKVKILSLFNN